MQSLCKPGQDLRVPVGWKSQVSRQSAHEVANVVSPAHRPPLPLRKYSWCSFLLESNSGPCCGREDYVNEKFQRHSTAWSQTNNSRLLTLNFFTIRINVIHLLPCLHSRIIFLKICLMCVTSPVQITQPFIMHLLSSRDKVCRSVLFVHLSCLSYSIRVLLRGWQTMFKTRIEQHVKQFYKDLL